MKSILSKKNKMLKLLVLVMVLAMSMMAFASCGGGGEEAAEPAETAETSDTITVTDHADRQVEVPTDIQRIAVCDIYPLPSVLAVFFDSAASSPELGDQLANAGFAAVAISVNKWDYNCIETLNNWIALLSQMFPDSDKAAIVEKKSNEMYDMVQERVKDIPDEERANAFFLFQYSDTTLLTSGQQFFGQWWADAIGANNVAKELSTDNSVAVNMEQVYSWNPDLIFMTNFNAYYPDDLYNNTVEGYDWRCRDQLVCGCPLGNG